MTENPNEKSAVTKGTFAAGFSVASVWFGTHVGAGFATGNQVITYYVQYGWTAVLYPLISMGILAYVIYTIMKFARLRGLDNYADTFRELWSPYPWLSITFEIFYIVIILAAVAAAISGAALLVDDVFHFPGGTEETASLLSTILVAVLLILLCLFGVKLIIAASTVLTVGIIVTAGLMIIIGVANRPDEVMEAFSRPLVTPGKAFWQGVIIYCAFQCVSIPPMIAAAVTLNQKGVKRASILGWLMNGGALAASGAMLLRWYPILTAIKSTGVDTVASIAARHIGDVMKLPNQSVVTLMGSGYTWLFVVYTILLFCAFVSTSVTLVYSMIQRFEGHCFPKAIKSKAVRSVIVGLIVIGLCYAVSLLGLSTIISKIYGYDGYYALIVVVLPAFIWGIPKIKKLSADKKAELSE